MSRPCVIAIIGKGLHCPDSVLALAYETGFVAASIPDPICIVTGGLAGVMHRGALGARDADATVLSLIPQGREVEAHDACTIQLNTGLSEPYRNVLLASMADGALMLPGSHGTVQEATVLIDAGKPVVAVGNHEGWRTATVDGAFRRLGVGDAVSVLADELGLRPPTVKALIRRAPTAI